MVFYWKDKTENQTTFAEELLSCNSVSSIQIASAFVSTEGANLLHQMKEQYRLSRENITLYLS